MRRRIQAVFNPIADKRRNILTANTLQKAVF